jgi:hypothetical protein
MKLSTKTEAEKADEFYNSKVKPAPKSKPPRYDKRKTYIQDKDLTMSETSKIAKALSIYRDLKDGTIYQDEVLEERQYTDKVVRAFKPEPKDIKAIVKDAKTRVDTDLKKIAPDVAIRMALDMSIWEYDEGRLQGSFDPNTYSSMITELE